MKTFSPCPILGILSLALLFTLPSCAAMNPAGPDLTQLEETVDEARLVFARFHGHPSMTWFREQMQRAKGVLILPSLTRAAYFLGGAWGHGVFSLRNEKTGLWSEPAFYKARAGSLGLQIGAKRSEMILLVMTDKGVNSLVSGTLVLGIDATVAVGPAGGGMKAGTTPGLSADMLAFMRSRGAFAGLSLQGKAVVANHEANEAYYAQAAEPSTLLHTDKVTHWYSERLRATLTRATGGSWPLSQHAADRL